MCQTLKSDKVGRYSVNVLGKYLFFAPRQISALILKTALRTLTGHCEYQGGIKIIFIYWHIYLAIRIRDAYLSLCGHVFNFPGGNKKFTSTFINSCVFVLLKFLFHHGHIFFSSK